MTFQAGAYTLTHMPNSLIERIDLRLKKIGKSDRAASIEATGSPDTIRHLRKGRVTNPRSDTIHALATALGTNSAWLISGEGPEDQTPVTKNQTATSGGSIPILGKAAGSILGAEILSESAVDYLRVPSNVLNMKDAYALWVDGISMIPKFEPGEPIIGAPHRPVRPNDFVIAQVYQNGSLAALVKRFVSKNEHRIKLQQFNEPSFIEIPHQEVYRLDRILTTAEILGL